MSGSGGIVLVMLLLWTRGRLAGLLCHMCATFIGATQLILQCVWTRLRSGESKGHFMESSKISAPCGRFVAWVGARERNEIRFAYRPF